LADIIIPENNIEAKFYKLDVTNKSKFHEIVKENKITNIIHLASLLSASCEKNLDLAMKVNIDGLHNALSIAKHENISIFIPSSIASFGSNLEKKPIEEDVIQYPNTFYGIGKVYTERLGTYYFERFNCDFRCLRFPAIISPYEYAGNGTLSYPTELIHNAIKNKTYKMYLDTDLSLPMMYIDDLVSGTISLIEASPFDLSRRVYNFQGLSFSPKEFIKELRKAINFQVEFEIDPLRNKIAKTWPVALDDKIARKDWGWKPQFDTTKKLVNKMIK